MCSRNQLLSLSIVVVLLASANAGASLLEDAVAAWQFDGTSALNGDPLLTISFNQGGCVPQKTAYPVKAPNSDGSVAKDDPMGAGTNSYCGGPVIPNAGHPLDITGTLTMFGRVRYSQFKVRNEVWRVGSSPDQLSRMYALEVNNGKARFIVWGQGQAGETYVSHDAELQTATWYDITGTFDAASQTITVCVYDPQTGREIGSPQSQAVPFKALYNGMSGGNLNWLVLEEPGNGTGINVGGEVDVAAVWDRELSRAEVASLSGGVAATSTSLAPKDKATEVLRDVVLTWLPGCFAAGHDVYFGTAFEDVSTADRANPKGVLMSQGETATSFDPAGLLALGQTYYWRVDEVNAAPDSTIYKGNVWSFTTEAYSYPIKPVKATASSQSNALTQPSKTVDGSGLDALDQHSTSASQMWLSKKSQTPVWIQYEFDAVYSLHQMWVWNQNQWMELDTGYGAKDVTIETSTDGTTWTPLAGIPEFAQATGEDSYVHNTTVEFSSVMAKFVKLNINSNWGDAKSSGLSEVRFFYVPVKAFGPTPATGATGVAVDSDLNWRSGRTAASHDVYFGSDPNVLSKVGTVTDHRYNLNSTGAEYDRTYYWKVNEVNEAQTPTTWEGDVWSFSTPGYVLVDNFDSYDDNCNRIFYTWVDGYGATPSPECGGVTMAGNGTGSAVGYPSAPYAERTVIYQGRQALPLFFDNAGAASVSEASRTFAVPQDWAQGGIKTLVLFFHGAADNAAGQLYVKINNTKVTYNGNAQALTMPLWKQWNVDLSSMDGALRSVTSLTIGVSGSGKGLVLIDDIRLYRAAPAVVSPVDPSTANRTVYYAMEGDAGDGSGKGYNGTLVGDPVFASSAAGLGQALLFDGVNDYVELPIAPLLSTLTSISVTGWVNFDTGGSGTGYYERFFDFGASSTINMFLTLRRGATGTMRFAITTGGSTAESGVNAEVPLPAGWHHLAGVIDAAAMTMQLYMDGSLVGNGTTVLVPKDMGTTTQNWLGRSQYTADNYFKGMMDNVSIYNKALSEGEVRYLAGDR